MNTNDGREYFETQVAIAEARLELAVRTWARRWHPGVDWTKFAGWVDPIVCFDALQPTGSVRPPIRLLAMVSAEALREAKRPL